MTDEPKEQILNLAELPPEELALPESQPAGAAAEAEKETAEKNAPENAPAPFGPETGAQPKKRPAPRRPVVVPQPARDAVGIKIEKILEEGLNEAFQRLSPIAKQEFKIKGEQTTSKILELLRATHVKVKKIFRLILEWLKMLPGVNHFYLEQEAKIKTDKIIALKK